jgi:RimJ/RimL family protein N-acetyltransferase
MAFLEPVTLTGRHVTLAPLSPDHAGDLIEAVKDGELWKLWYTFIPAPEHMEAEIARRLALQSEGKMQPFAVMVDGRAAGMTTYMNMEAAHRRVEVGSTWYRASLQRSGVNTECKLMLLTRAFEVMDCISVALTTHAMNVQSRRGIERLGAKLDGVLRSNMIMPNGSLRDSAFYSIIASEWPAVKANLAWQLEKPRS